MRECQGASASVSETQYVLTTSVVLFVSCGASDLLLRPSSPQCCAYRRRCLHALIWLYNAR